MVSKLTDRKVEQKKVEIAKPKPAAAKPVAKKLLGKDELSTGKGQRLRAGAEKQLASTPFTAKGSLDAAVSGSFRVNALGALSKSADVQAVARTAAGAVPSDEVKDKAQRNLDFVRDSASFGAALSREQDPAVRDEMVRQAMASDHPEVYLAQPGFGSGSLNQDFDYMKSVASAVDHAFRNGAITQEDVNHAVHEMGEDNAEFFVQSMSIEGNNRALGGAVEAIGVAAQAEGFKRVEALAFTTSEAMIDKHYPTAADQRAAFEQVKAYIEDYDDVVHGDEGESAELRNAMEFALASAARLSARGNGYTDAELDEELKEVGPRVAQETVSRLGEAARFDDRVPGALDQLGDAAKRLGAQDNDDADDFRVASAIAYTQSPQLISQNLTSDKDKMAALSTINAFLADRRESWGDAANEGFTLLRDPQALDGLNRLLETNPQLIGQLLDNVNQPQVDGHDAPPGSGEATLVQLFETISLDPNVPAAERDRFNASVNRFTETALATATENPNQTGAQIGKLFGVIQVAGNRAVEEADGPGKDKTRELVQGVVKGAATALVGLALAETGPIGAAVGKVVIGQVVDAIFGENPGPTAAQVRAAFTAQLEAAGINVSSGEAGQDAITAVFRQTLDALNNALRDAPASEKDAIQQQINRLSQLNTQIEALFSQTIDSGTEGAGELQKELDRRKDEL